MDVSIVGQADRQKRHVACIDAINHLRSSVVELEDLKEEILGQKGLKSDAEKKQLEAQPSLSLFLEETPGKLSVLADKIREAVKIIRDGIF